MLKRRYTKSKTLSAAVSNLGLFQVSDFYWDPTDNCLRYDAPNVPDDWREREATESSDFGLGGSSLVVLSDDESDEFERIERNLSWFIRST
ncbi:hypothetical protein [Halorussus salinisoli]|uniref:hypothetical protein n=1 Tax=Halorussus salinisoli TaxID=2558242 RepID=UPI0010C22966|nr:hypothetical protein [Halorussus salinisoli]